MFPETVLFDKELLPIAIALLPDKLLYKASHPIAILRHPVVLEIRG